MIHEQDDARFARAIAVLEEVYGKVLADVAQEGYWFGLEDFPIEAVELACERAMKRLRFFPTPAELREQVEGTEADAAQKAWEDLEQSYRKAGIWSSVIFEDGAIGVAIERVFGTWVSFAEEMNRLSPEMVRAREKDFRDCYRRTVREGVTFGPRYLRGYIESQNRETAGKWTKGIPTLDGERRILRQGVWFQPKDGEGKLVDAEFDFDTGELLTTIGMMIASGPIRRKVLASGPVLDRVELIEGTWVDPDEVRAQVKGQVGAMLESVRIPRAALPMTDEEWEARREELKRQERELEGLSE